jgi:hypothetical protein
MGMDVKSLSAGADTHIRSLDTVWQDGLWPDVEEPDPGASVRHAAISEVLRSIPEEWYYGIKVLRMLGMFQWFVAPYGVDGWCLPVRRRSRPCVVAYLSPRLECQAWDIVIAVTAQQLAYAALFYSRGLRYSGQEEEAFDLVCKWGFEREARKHRAMLQRRERLYTRGQSPKPARDEDGHGRH